MTRPLLAVLAGSLVLTVAVVVCVRAANTGWAVPVAAVLVAAAFLGDVLSERRPSGLSALQRFERRQARRDERRAA